MLDLASLTQLDLHGVLERAELPDLDQPVETPGEDQRLACALAMVELGHLAARRPAAREPSPSIKEGTEESWI